jgi:hypothetical protein
MSLRDILMPGSIRKLADAVRAIVGALEFIQTGEEIPVRFRRRLAPVVIGQDGFLPPARGIVWDLRTKHPGGYYLPLDLSAPLPTHLNTSAYFDALGDDYPDQSFATKSIMAPSSLPTWTSRSWSAPTSSRLPTVCQRRQELRRSRSLGYAEFSNNEESALVRGTSAAGTVDVQLAIVAAFLTTFRHSGSRKTDLLDHTATDVNAASRTRRNVKWRIRGVTYDSPSVVALRHLRKGDCAVLLPGSTKNDPFALHFGDRPTYLPFLPDDPTNAAFRLQQPELLCPVPASSRRWSPLFCSDDTSRSLTHAQAGGTFNALATLAPGSAAAMALSLRSGRV